MGKGGSEMTVNEAIEVLKDYRKGDFVGDDLLCRAIDTVVDNLAHLNTENKTGLDERLQEKSIEVSDSQEGLSNKKDRIYTAKDMESFAEWMSLKEYSYHPKAKMWTYGMANRKTTSQLREQWEQERGEK